MQYCDYCGKEIPNSAQFCRHCGEKVDGTEHVWNNDPGLTAKSSLTTDVVPDKSNKADEDTPKPWIRLWARYIDISFFTLISGFIVSLFIELKNGPLMGFDLFGFGCLIVGSITLEAICLTIVGTTPGKSLANIKLSDLSGGKLSLQQSLSRTFQVWAKGLWFGFPIIFLIAMFMARADLLKYGSNSWDVFCGTKITHGRVGFGRYAGIIIALILIFILNAYVTLENQQINKYKGKASLEYAMSENRPTKLLAHEETRTTYFPKGLGQKLGFVFPSMVLNRLK